MYWIMESAARSICRPAVDSGIRSFSRSPKIGILSPFVLRTAARRSAGVPGGLVENDAWLVVTPG